MEKIINGFKNFFNKVYKNEYVRVFVIIFVLGFIFFGTTALGNGLTMSFGGDYELQTLALYSDGYTKLWNFIKTGEFPMYDFSNGFGHDYVAGASFYYLTSPFYYLLLLFPQKYIFQGIYILLLLKYAVGGLLFYVLLKKYYGYKNLTCLVGGIVYAFSGWNLYNLWFHFADAMALFPLLIIGIENCLRKHKGGLITFSLFILAMCNYFMFVPFAIFGVFYFIFRWIKIYGVTKRNGYTFWQRWNVAIKGALSYISGGLMACIILIPNLMFSQESGRVDYDAGLLQQFLSFFFKYETVDGEIVRTGFKSLGDIFNKENLKALYNYMFVWGDTSSWGAIDPKRVKLFIVVNFLFMNSDCINNTVFYVGGLDNMIGGLFISTPLILLFIPTVINTFKSKKKWDIFTLIFCCIIPFIPFTFYLMGGFSKAYGRWELILVVLMLIYVLKTFDKIEYVNKWMFTIGIVVNVALAGYCVYYSYKTGLIDMQYRILIIIGELLFMFIAYHLTFVYHEKAWFKKFATGGIVLELFVSTVITINMHGVTNYETLYDGSAVLNEERQVINDLKEKDSDFYRIYNSKATRNYLNMPSVLSYNGTSTFNTIYNGYNVDFIYRSDLLYAGSLGGGALSMAYHEKRPYFDQFVGTKYYIVDKVNPNNDTSYMGDIYSGGTALVGKQEFAPNIPFGYEKLDTNYEYFDVYENKEYIELGFATENYIENQGTGLSNTHYETLYSNSVIIDKANKDIYGDDYQEKVVDKLMFFNKKYSNSNDSYSEVVARNLKKTISMRNDMKIQPGDITSREEFVINSHQELLNVFHNHSQYGQYGDIMHGRWYDYPLSDGTTVPIYGDQIILTPINNATIAKDATVDNPANVILYFPMGPQCVVSLYGEGDKLLTQDAHQVHHYQISGSWENKYERSYYVTEEVKKIVIEFIYDACLYFTTEGASLTDPYGNGAIDKIKVNYSYYEDFKEDWAFAKEHQLQNIEYSTNGFKFDTNYESKKLVCLNVPYGDGWTLKMDNEKVDIILLNGGFIGFMAPSGNHSYTLDYLTPHLDIGVPMAIGGVGLGLITFVGYNFHYCLAVTKSICSSTILSKKRKDEDGNDLPLEPNEEENNVDIKETNEENNKINKVASIMIHIIIALISLVVGVLVASLFKSNIILGAVGLILGYTLSSVISYFGSYFFKLIDLDKSSIIRYLKISGVGLSIALLIYLILSLLKVYFIFKLIICYIVTYPVLYLLHKNLLKNIF